MASRKRVRYTFDVHFSSVAEKSAFSDRLRRVRDILSQPGTSLDNQQLMTALFDAVESHPPAHPPSQATQQQEQLYVASKSFLRNGGIYTTEHESDGGRTHSQPLFISEIDSFSDLCEGLVSACSCGAKSAWALQSTRQRGHVLRAEFRCVHCHRYRRTWSSSRVFGGHYLVNQKLVHSFTCAGILPSQYFNLSTFAELGVVGAGYISQVYNKCWYANVVDRAAQQSMQAAVEEVQSLPTYQSSGEWVITDARHDSTANAYHTTVPCIAGSNQKIVGLSTISRADHSTAQTREAECTKVVLPQVMARGLNVVEVAHDIQTQVARYVKSDLGLLNSFDTWHGTKNVGKQLAKISHGCKKDMHVTWFPELADKCKSVKVHMYWAMKNCEGSADKLRSLVLAIPRHYKGDHSLCHNSSPCHMSNYVPSKVQLSNPCAIEKLEAVIRLTYIFRNAESFCRCRDTYWIESFNHQLLTYLPKRIHFSTDTFNMRMNLALMDWNENVGRGHTSEQRYRDLRRPDRRTSMRVLIPKSFNFVDVIWSMYMATNCINLEPCTESDEPSDDCDGELMRDGDIVESDDDDDEMEDDIT